MIDDVDVKLLNILRSEPDISNKKICELLEIEKDRVSYRLDMLEKYNYIRRTNNLIRNSPWKVLRENDDKVTRIISQDEYLWYLDHK